MSNLVVVQQYLNWKGHYRKYFENLRDSKYRYLYVSNLKQPYDNAVWVQSEFNPEREWTIVSRIQGRFLESFKAFKWLSTMSLDAVHFIEFEPLTYLLMERFFKGKPKLLITIHSSAKLHFDGWISNKISGFQRYLLNTALKRAVIKGALVVTHYECHKESIVEIIGEEFRDRVTVIHYPTPEVLSTNAKQILNTSNPKFLIYGQIREDKGIYEFLCDKSTEGLNVTIAGKIQDSRIFEFKNRRGLDIIDKFLTDNEIVDLIQSHDYMLLPYPPKYTNGAGTFKDSLAKGMPVVCTNIPIFKEIVDKYKVGIMFDSPNQISSSVPQVTELEYKNFSESCLRYASHYNWDYMKAEYFSLYEKLLSSRR